MTIIIKFLNKIVAKGFIKIVSNENSKLENELRVITYIYFVACIIDVFPIF